MLKYSNNLLFRDCSSWNKVNIWISKTQGINWKLNSYFDYLCEISRLTSKNKNINHLKQNSNDFKIQLAREIRTDVFSLYRKMSSLGAPEEYNNLLLKLAQWRTYWILFITGQQETESNYNHSSPKLELYSRNRHDFSKTFLGIKQYIKWHSYMYELFKHYNV